METTNLFGAILRILLLWAVSSPIYLPWILSRFGRYKAWYWAPFIPPFSWRGWIQIWPASLFFFVIPFLGLFPEGELGLLIWGGFGFFGFFMAIVMIIVNPRWAKPEWQRRLEDRYTHREISGFIRVWRKAISYDKWSRLIETEEGMLELVAIAQNYQS